MNELLLFIGSLLNNAVMPNAQDLFNAYRDRSAAKLAYQCANGLMEIPAYESGKETQQFNVGQVLTATDKVNGIPNGSKGVITGFYEENGYFRYYVSWKFTYKGKRIVSPQVHRQIDLL